MIPGKLTPGPSGQAANVGILPCLVVTTISFSIMLVSSHIARADKRQRRVIAGLCHASLLSVR
jgi:hypothetical protein